MKLVSAQTLLIAALVGGIVGTSSTGAQTLTSRSPFMPEGTPAAPVAPTENAPLELRGIVSTKAGYLYGIFDPTKRQSVWVRKDEPGADFSVRAHDEANDTVTVEYQGRTMTLGLKAAKVESMGPVPNPAQMMVQRPNQPQPNMPPMPVPPPANASAADEARRLEGVAAEVRRRRMLRQAAAQAGQPPQSQAPQPQPQPGAQPLPR